MSEQFQENMDEIREDIFHQIDEIVEKIEKVPRAPSQILEIHETAPVIIRNDVKTEEKENTSDVPADQALELTKEEEHELERVSASLTETVLTETINEITRTRTTAATDEGIERKTPIEEVIETIIIETEAKDQDVVEVIPDVTVLEVATVDEHPPSEGEIFTEKIEVIEAVQIEPVTETSNSSVHSPEFLASPEKIEMEESIEQVERNENSITEIAESVVAVRINEDTTIIHTTTSHNKDDEPIPSSTIEESKVEFPVTETDASVSLVDEKAVTNPVHPLHKETELAVEAVLAVSETENQSPNPVSEGINPIVEVSESEKAEGPVQFSVTFETSNHWYENLKTYFSNSAVGEKRYIACNSEYFAYLDTQGSGSSIAVLPYTSYGKNHVPVNSPAYQQPIIRAHSQLVSDFAFSPFHTNILYSCAADRLLKLWKLPEQGLTVDMSVATNSISMKSKAPLRSLAVSTIADDLVAVEGGREISVFDMKAVKEVYTTTDRNSFFQGDILSLTWSYQNNYLYTTSKDKMIKLFDPRINPKQFSIVRDWLGHSGFRYSSLIPLEDNISLFSFGHNSKTQEREIYLWDLRNPTGGPVIKEVVDKKDGALYPIYDEDHRLLYVSGKGDSQLHLYRIASDRSSLDELLNENVLTESFHGRDVIKGITLLPKTSKLLQSKKEVSRILKLSEGLIQPLIVSSTASMPEEGMITRSGAPAALTAAQWIEGEVKPPRTVIVLPSESNNSEGENTEDRSNEKGPAVDESTDIAPGLTGGAHASKRASALRVSQSTMKYRHIYGKEPKKELTYFSLQPDLTALDSPIIAANEHYWAIPYRGGGGPVYLSRHSSYGKVLPECLTINGHKSSIQEIAFSPFHEDLMITGSFDCTMKLWDVKSVLEAYDAELLKTQQSKPKITSINMTWKDSLAHFTQHSNSIRTVNFHPTVPNLFCSTAQDMTLRFFDLNTIQELSCLRIPNTGGNSAADVANALISNLSFNYDGTHLLMASKDRQIRSIDPRVNTIVETINNPKYLGRNLRVAWCAKSLAEDPVVSVSAGSGGLRQIALWDRRNWTEPIAVRMIDNASGQLYPMYDEGLNVIFVAGKGDTIIRGFEISSLTTEGTTATTTTAETITTGESSSPEYHYLMEKCFDYQTLGRDSIAGICMLPKRIVDIRNVEVTRLLKLSTDSVTTIHFHVPRADYLKDYFHDDIYRPIRSNTESHATITDWKDLNNISNILFSPILESLKPAEMMNVSEKPVAPLPSETNSKIHSYKQKIAAKEEETKQNEEKFNRLQALAFQNAQYHKNASGPMKIGAVVVTNPQLKEVKGKSGGDDDDSDDETDWS